jgi:hypothetical protein
MRTVEKPQGEQSYRDFIRKNNLCVSSDAVEKPADTYLFIDREPFDKRDHLYENGLGLYAWDLVVSKVVTQGQAPLAFQNTGKANTDHFIWQSNLRLPIKGHLGATQDQALIVALDKSFTDIAPSDAPPISQLGMENFIVAGVYGRFAVMVVHLAQNSIPAAIQANSMVGATDVLAKVGNSGWSNYPHVHLTLSWDDTTGATQRPWGVPTEFCKTSLKSDWNAAAKDYEFVTPRAGQFIVK